MSAGWQIADDEGLPKVFTGGWVGYSGYDTVRYVYSGNACLSVSTATTLSEDVVSAAECHANIPLPCMSCTLMVNNAKHHTAWAWYN